MLLLSHFRRVSAAGSALPLVSTQLEEEAAARGVTALQPSRQRLARVRQPQVHREWVERHRAQVQAWAVTVLQAGHGAWRPSRQQRRRVASPALRTEVQGQALEQAQQSAQGEAADAKARLQASKGCST